MIDAGANPSPPAEGPAVEKIREDAVWDLIDDAVDRFERARREDDSAELARFLPATDAVTRRLVLTHLIPIDLECRWNRGEHCRIELYLQQWQDLQDDETALLDLLNAECRIRASSGAPVTRDELRERFPTIAARVQLADIDQRDGLPFALDIDSKSLHDLVTSLGDALRGAAAADRVPCLSPGTVLGESDTVLGKFRIRAVLGRGGMGTVYLADDDELRRSVAIKVLHSALFSSDEAKSRLLEEARAAAQLNHEGIVAIYGVGREDDGTCFLVMEYVDGDTLADRIKVQAIGNDEAARIGLQIAEALGYAHAQGFVHRDIKPGNILIDRRNRVRITDFGLATQSQLQSSGDIGLAGTLPYMAPEQLAGRTNQLDGRADIWALGVVLYEMLTGQRPFQAKTFDGWLETIPRDNPTNPRRIRRGLSHELVWICRECLQKDPDRRYATASEVAVDLRETTTPRRRLWRWFVGVAAVLFVLLVPVDYFCDRYLVNDSLDFAFSSTGGWLVCHDCYYCDGWLKYWRLPSDVRAKIQEIYTGNGAIIGAGLNDEEQWLIIYQRNGDRERSCSNIPPAMQEALIRIEAGGGELQDAAISPEGGWIVVYQQGLQWKWEYAGIPDDAKELLEQIQAADTRIGGVGLAPGGGWIITYRDRFQNSWRCSYRQMPWEVVQYLKANRGKLHLRHAEGTSVMPTPPFAVPAA